MTVLIAHIDTIEKITDLLQELQNKMDEMEYALLDIQQMTEEALEYPAERTDSRMRAITERAKKALQIIT